MILDLLQLVWFPNTFGLFDPMRYPWGWVQYSIYFRGNLVIFRLQWDICLRTTNLESSNPLRLLVHTNAATFLLESRRILSMSNRRRFPSDFKALFSPAAAASGAQTAATNEKKSPAAILFTQNYAKSAKILPSSSFWKRI